MIRVMAVVCAPSPASRTGKTGILYDAFHFIALLKRRSSVALQECALTENASAHGDARFRIH